MQGVTNFSVLLNGSHDNGLFIPPGSSNNGDSSFFDTYFSVPRFVTETVLGTMSIFSNALALGAFNYVHGRQTAYHILFLNLAIGNILSTMLSWLCNNVLFLFENRLISMLLAGSSMCEVFVFLLAAVFASSAFGIVSTLTMLGFTTVQYFAVCRPLHHSSIVRKRRICIFIMCTWIISLGSACLPFSILMTMTSSGTCDENMLGNIFVVVVVGTNVSIAVVVITYLSIVALCLRIYVEIRQLKRRLSQFRFEHEVSGERTAFVTIVILLTTLTAFFIPYAAVYVISLNSNSEIDMQNNILIYYMNILPYLKFFTDPIIYGMRMREVREGWSRMMLTCGLRRCACVRNEFAFVPQSTASALSTAQVTTV